MAKDEGLLDRIGKAKIGRFKIGSLLVNTDDDYKEEPVATSGAPAAAPAQTQYQAATVVAARSFVPSSNVDPVIRAKVEQIARSADQVSYTKFSEVLVGMRVAFPGDDNAAFKAAISASKAFGYPMTEVLKGLDSILNQLSKAEEQFKTAVPSQIANKVGARRQKIQELNQASQNNQQSINSVQAELGRLQIQASSLANELQSESAAISQDEQLIRNDETKFVAAMQDVRGGYLAEKQKLELYGKEIV